MRVTEWLNDGFVTINVPAKGSLSWGFWQEHDEGWSSEYREWWQEDGRVFSRVNSDGTDCDGRLSTDTLVVWNPAEMWTDGFGNERKGRWERVDSSQRDYFAEAMGY